MTKPTIADSTDANGVCWLDSPDDQAFHTAGLRCPCGSTPRLIPGGRSYWDYHAIECSGTNCDRRAEGKTWKEVAEAWADSITIEKCQRHGYVKDAHGPGYHCPHCPARFRAVDGAIQLYP